MRQLPSSRHLRGRIFASAAHTRAGRIFSRRPTGRIGPPRVSSPEMHDCQKCARRTRFVSSAYPRDSPRVQPARVCAHTHTYYTRAHRNCKLTFALSTWRKKRERIRGASTSCIARYNGADIAIVLDEVKIRRDTSGLRVGINQLINRLSSTIDLAYLLRFISRAIVLARKTATGIRGIAPRQYCSFTL